MTTAQTALVEILAEQAEARLKELVEQARTEFYEAADRAFAQGMERFFRPFPAIDSDPDRDNEAHNGCRHAG